MDNRYYEPALDIDGTAEELFIQARNGYVESPAALKVIAEILRNPAEKQDEKAKYVDVLAEITEAPADKPYKFAQFKKDILDGCGSEETELRDGLLLSILHERDSVVVALTETYPEYRTGAAAKDKDEFMRMTAKEFDEFVDAIYFYNMERIE